MTSSDTVGLIQVDFKNFRCFTDHTIHFPRQSLLVGKNNAGKSTCVEGLRLISLISERLKGLPLKPPPEDFDLPLHSKGFCPSLESISIQKHSLFHRYGEPPALVSGLFSNGSRMDVHIGDELLIHAVIYDAQGRAANNKGAVEKACIPKVSILPQIAPLAIEEGIRIDSYVKANLQTLRSSLHFRNQIRLFPEYFEQFKAMVAETWPGIQVTKLDLPHFMNPNGPLNLWIRDEDFTAEVSWMGHGLQMWLQTMWFFCRNRDSSVIILDEPDVYMHADLQRRLIRMLRRDPRQFIVATHSPEMLAEVEPSSVVVLDRRLPESRSAASSQVVQKLLESVGSVHNLSLARLATYKKILLVEGQDVRLLKMFQDALDPSARLAIDVLPNSDIEGWSKWPAVLTMAKFFRKNQIGGIEITCVLDRDYHTQEDIEGRIREATKAGVRLIVWDAKELENYAILPSVLARLISSKGKRDVNEDVVRQKIDQLANGLKDETIDDYSEAIRNERRCGPKESNPAARKIVEERWQIAGPVAVVGGKKLLSALSSWSQKEFGVSLNVGGLIKEMRSEEVATPVADLIRALTMD